MRGSRYRWESAQCPLCEPQRTVLWKVDSHRMTQQFHSQARTQEKRNRGPTRTFVHAHAEQWKSARWDSARHYQARSPDTQKRCYSE